MSEDQTERYFGRTKDVSIHGATDDKFWFSHITQEYEVTDNGSIKQFRINRSKPPVKLDWDNCTVNIATILPDGRIRFVIRSNTNRNSDYMGNKPVQLRFMLGIDTSANAISEIRTEKYHIDRDTKRSSLRSLEFVQREEEHERSVFSLGSDAEVWQWVDKNKDLRSSPIYRLREEVRKFLDNPPQNDDVGKKIFRVQVDRLEEVVPVIYQPAVDSLDNFLREVHCHVNKNQDDSIDVEVSLLFNNEYLRRFWFVDHGYRWFRKLKYGRLIDIETFHIHFVRDKLDSNYFLFEYIYSGSHTLEDSVHLDGGKRVEHEISYYLADQYHPIVFVNTSNHAMAEHDTNHQLWKWEYIPWIEGAPVKRGSKSRREINSEYRTILDWLMRIFRL